MLCLNVITKLLEINLKTESYTTVEVGAACIEIHEVDRRVEHTEVLALNIEFQATETDFAEQLLIEIITEREVTDLVVKVFHIRASFTLSKIE